MRLVASSPSSGPAPAWPPPADAVDVQLELLRLSQVSDAHGVVAGANAYALRKGRGEYEASVLSWDADVVAELDRLQGLPPCLDAAEALAARLQTMLDDVGWGGVGARLRAARRAGAPVQLTVIAAGAELYSLPWELLRFEGQTLAQQQDLLLKYELPRDRARPVALSALARAPGGRILVAWSDAAVPEHPVGGQRHLGAIRQAAAAGGLPGAPAVVGLRDVGLDDLETTLAQAAEAGTPFRALHLLCHGVEAIVDGQPGFGLGFSDPDDPMEGCVVVTPERLAAALRPFADTLRLVVLCACHGSTMGQPGSRVGSVAQAVHAAGIESVLASRYVLTLRGARAMTERLYDRLLVGLESLETAVREAHGLLRDDLDPIALQLYARGGADLVDTRPFTYRPYRGLSAYGRGDGRFFFGRTSEVQALRDLVLAAAAEPEQAPSVLVVSGPSGSGKSSLVRAGLLPALGAAWRPVVLRAGDADAPITLATAIGARGDDRLLVVVDQAEELVTRLDAPHARTLAGALLAATANAPGQVVIVLTVRMDYQGRLGEVVVDGVPFDRRLQDQPGPSSGWLLPLARMGPAQLAEVIERPAARVGLRYAPGLVDDILVNLGDARGSLPLLGYALDQLWERRTGRVLDDATYRASAGGRLRRRRRRAGRSTLPGLGPGQRGPAAELGRAGP